jgi:hypothetical protein
MVLHLQLNTPLYLGCDMKKFSILSMVLKLLNLKTRYSRSDRSFTELLCLLSEILPTGNKVPTSTYDAKKITCPRTTGALPTAETTEGERI